MERFTYLVLSALLVSAVNAQDLQSPLPSPLTLEYALSLADDSAIPDIQNLVADKALAVASQKSIEADANLSLTLNGRLRWSKPATTIATTDSIVDDHRVSLNLSKSLYDFSGRDALVEAASLGVKQSELYIEHAYKERRLEIMRRFFDVLLADLQYDRDNEELAIVYIRFNKLQERNQLGQVSDIELFEQDALVQAALAKRDQSQGQQRATRAQLAFVLNRPDDMPSDLSRPQLSKVWQTVPEFETLKKIVLNHNRVLLALNEKLNAASITIGAAKQSAYPDVIGEIEVADQSRQLGSSDSFRIGLSVSVPIIDGGKQSAGVAQATAKYNQIKSQRDIYQRTLMQDVLNTYLQLKQLKLKSREIEKQREFRELYLDRSRANYELEFQADLGDAMVKLSEVQLQEAKIEFDATLAWENLRLLTANQIDMLNSTESN